MPVHWLTPSSCRSGVVVPYFSFAKPPDQDRNCVGNCAGLSWVRIAARVSSSHQEKPKISAKGKQLAARIEHIIGASWNRLELGYPCLPLSCLPYIFATGPGSGISLEIEEEARFSWIKLGQLGGIWEQCVEMYKERKILETVCLWGQHRDHNRW